VYYPWEAFNGVIDDDTATDAWQPGYNIGGDFDTSGVATTQTRFNPGGGAALVNGPALIIQFPHKVVVTSYDVYARKAGDVSYGFANKPKSGRVYGSNDGSIWTHVDTFGDWTSWVANTPQTETVTTPGAYNRYALVVESMIYQSQTWVAICEWKLYGHRENDLVRLPDPTNVLKYPHIAMTGPAQRGYVATHGTSVFSSRVGYRVFSGNTNSSWETDNNAYDLTNNGVAQTGTATFGAYTGHWVKLELPHKIVVSGITLYSYLNNSNSADDRRPDAGAFLGSDDDSTWNLIHAFGSGSLTWTSPSTTNVNLRETNISSMSASNTNAYKYIVFVIRTLRHRRELLHSHPDRWWEHRQGGEL
jgi:hypothetical protein